MNSECAKDKISGLTWKPTKSFDQKQERLIHRLDTKGAVSTESIFFMVEHFGYQKYECSERLESAQSALKWKMARHCAGKRSAPSTSLPYKMNGRKALAAQNMLSVDTGPNAGTNKAEELTNTEWKRQTQIHKEMTTHDRNQVWGKGEWPTAGHTETIKGTIMS